MNLFKNESGRYVLNGYELTSGDVIEVKRGDHWERGRVEYDHERGDYVIVLALGGVMLFSADLVARALTK